MRNPNAPHIDFTELIGIIPNNPKALPSNLDMVYERKGHFLLAEWKYPDEQLSKGQEILLQNLAKNTSFIVIIIYGDTSNKQMTIKGFFRYTFEGNLIHLGNTKQDLFSFINRWYNWANILNTTP